MKRKRLPPISAKQRAYLDELQRQLPDLYARCSGICEVCNKAPVDQAHHKRRRSQGGGNSLDNLLAVCLGCHQAIHAHPSASYEAGYLTRG